MIVTYKLPHKYEIRRIAPLIPVDEVYESIIDALSKINYFKHIRPSNIELCGDTIAVTVGDEDEYIVMPKVLAVTVKIKITDKNNKRISVKSYTFQLVSLSKG